MDRIVAGMVTKMGGKGIPAAEPTRAQLAFVADAIKDLLLAMRAVVGGRRAVQQQPPRG